MHRLNNFEQTWERQGAYWLLESGKHYRQLLLDRCSEDLLNAWNVRLVPKDCVLQSGHVEVFLTANNDHYYLRVHPTGEHTYCWELSGHRMDLTWFRERVEDRDLAKRLTILLHQTSADYKAGWRKARYWNFHPEELKKQIQTITQTLTDECWLRYLEGLHDGAVFARKKKLAE